MKSLEIINYNLNVQEFLKSDYIYEREKNYEKIDNEFLKEFDKRIEKLETIQQDLEVLKIIISKRVNVAVFMNFLKIEDNEKILEIYNHVNYAQSKLTLEEIVKLKQWLKENEHDNKSL